MWGSTTEDGRPLGDGCQTPDLAPTVVEAMRSELERFMSHCIKLGLLGRFPGTSDDFGHCFWATRNGYPEGFVDRGWGELGDQLAKAAKTFSVCEL